MNAYVSTWQSFGLACLWLLLILVWAGCSIIAHDVKHLRYGSGRKVEPGWRWGGWLAAIAMVVVFVVFLATVKPQPSKYQIVQDKVNACLKAGGTPIVTDAGTRASTWPHYWGCEK